MNCFPAVSWAGTSRRADMHHWSVSKDLDNASHAAADFLAENIMDSIAARGVCHVIVPGGSTPARCFDYLVEKSLPWDKVHWYPGDERCYPTGHPERNDVMLREHLLSRIPSSHFHGITAERGAKRAAADYQEQIRAIDAFDIAFLGMGEDGHTASLFPGNAALQDKQRVVAVFEAPKPPSERVSLGMDTLRQSRVRMVLAAGAGKADIIRRIRAGEALPVNSIGVIYWFLDETCWAKRPGDENN